MPRVERARSEDVTLDEALTFADLQLSDALVRGLRRCGLHTPSPVQRAAIPLGRAGADLVVQAKSGTGKTITFGAILLERVDRAVAHTQALVVAPTREVAQQSHATLARLAEASGFSDGNRPLRTHLAVGGVRVEVDRAALATGDAHVVIGTPGRLRQLVEEGSLRADDVRVFVLDEADALTRGSFEADVLFLRAMAGAKTDATDRTRALTDTHVTSHAVCVTTSTAVTAASSWSSSENASGARSGGPSRTQTLAFSATYPPETVARVESMTIDPRRVQLCTQATSGLLAVRQFFVNCGDGGDDEKDAALLNVFRRVAFHQCVLFVKRPARGEALARKLERSGVKAGFVCGATPQTERFAAMRRMRDFELRVLVSTDLTSRGVDLERVNLVAHMDAAPDAAAYAHRVGRAGRFGANAMSVAFVTRAELSVLRAMLTNTNHELRELPDGRDAVPRDWYAHDLDARDAEKAEALARAGAAAAAAAAAAEAAEAAEAAARVEAEEAAARVEDEASRECVEWDEGASYETFREEDATDVGPPGDSVSAAPARDAARNRDGSDFDFAWAARRAWASWWWWRWRDEQQAAFARPRSFEQAPVGAGAPWVVPPLRSLRNL